MTKDPKGLRAVLREVAQSSERSTLFWWLVEHHRELKAGSMGRRLKWEKLSALFNELGLTDINGNPAKPNTARQTWLRARRFVAEEEQRLAASGSHPEWKWAAGTKRTGQTAASGSAGHTGWRPAGRVIASGSQSATCRGNGEKGVFRAR
jgi:hypothetical protein